MLEALDDREKSAVRRAVIAAADGPFFPDWEFNTLFGVGRADMRRIGASLPELAPSDFGPVNNTLFMFTTYPIKPKDRLVEFGLDLAELAGLLKKIRKSLGKPTEQFLDFME